MSSERQTSFEFVHVSITDSRVELPAGWETPDWSSFPQVRDTVLRGALCDETNVIKAKLRARLLLDIDHYISRWVDREQAIEAVLAQIITLYHTIKPECQLPNVLMHKKRKVAQYALGLGGHLCENYKPQNNKFFLFIVYEYFSTYWMHNFQYTSYFIDPYYTGLRKPLRLDAVNFFIQQTKPLVFFYKVNGFEVETSDKLSPLLIERTFERRCEFVDFPLTVVNNPDVCITSLFMSCLRGLPERVLLLLRYGAQPMLGYKLKELDPKERISHSLSVVWYMLKLNKESISLEDELSTTDDNEKEKFMKHIRCLRILLRADPFLPLRFTSRMIDSHDKPGVDERLAELLPSCLLEVVPSLQRQCRWSIRNVLRDHGALPDGVWQLDLATVLLHYLNLSID